MATTSSVTPERIRQFAWGYAPTLVLEASIRHGIFDLLEGDPKTLDEIQRQSGASERGLTAIVNALVGMDLLAKDEHGAFSLTPESAVFLVKSKPGYLGGLIRHTSEHLIPKWLHLSEIVATGKPKQSVNQEASGSDFFKNFVNDIFPMSYPAAQTLAASLDLNGPAVRVLDLAAGSGVWGIALAQKWEQIRVSAVDWPQVIPITRETVGKFGLAGRFSFIEGDLHTADFGGDYTLAVLGHILHSEGRERSQALLAKTFQALRSGGTIAIAEFLVDGDRRGPLNGLLFAVNMLVNTDYGDAFSLDEIAGWLTESGFTNARQLQSPGSSPLILATKP